jgi:hypothetical protein
MAFEGLVQWTYCVVSQAQRVFDATNSLGSLIRVRDVTERRRVALAPQCEYHFFAIAAHKLPEHRRWVKKFGLCENVDFSEIDGFSADDIRDLRNMREHVVDYFMGFGRDMDRWWIQKSGVKADASAVYGTLIGGRLDWAKFAEAASRLLPRLLAESIPFPKSVR